MNEEYKLCMCIWNGTLTSRDTVEPKLFDSRKKCMNALKEAKEHYAKMRYRIWFAYIIHPNGTTEHL